MTHTDDKLAERDEDRPIQVQSIAVIIQHATSCDDDDAIKAAYNIWDYTGHPKCTGKNDGDKADALQDSAYIAGMQEGFRLGLDENHEGVAKRIAARDGYLASITRPAPAAEIALAKRPVAFRVNFKDGPLIYDDEADAHEAAKDNDVDYQGLYVRDGTPLVDAPAAEVGERFVEIVFDGPTMSSHEWASQAVTPSPEPQIDPAPSKAWQPGDPRCDQCDNGIEPKWEHCAWCGQHLTTKDVPA